MSSIANSAPARYAYGTARIHDEGPDALRYEPLAGDQEPHDAAYGLPPEGWTYDDVREFRAAELSDMRRDFAGGR